MATAAATKAIRLGHPSYVWRRGQDRRLAFIRQYVELRAKRILDIGCGLGMYVSQFRQFSDDVYGVDIDPDKIAQASEWLPNLRVAPAEELPFPDDSFDLILLNEVIEHVDDDRCTIREAYRVLAPGGHYLFSVWDEYRFNPAPRLVHEMLGGLFPDDPPRFYEVPFAYHRIDPIREAATEAGFGDFRAAVLHIDKRVPDMALFARGLIYGNPVVEQIRSRGGDPGLILDKLTENLRREFGDPGHVLLQIIVFEVTRS